MTVLQQPLCWYWRYLIIQATAKWTQIRLYTSLQTWTKCSLRFLISRTFKLIVFVSVEETNKLWEKTNTSGFTQLITEWNMRTAKQTKSAPCVCISWITRLAILDWILHNFNRASFHSKHSKIYRQWCSGLWRCIFLLPTWRWNDIFLRNVGIQTRLHGSTA